MGFFVKLPIYLVEQTDDVDYELLNLPVPEEEGVVSDVYLNIDAIERINEAPAEEYYNSCLWTTDNQRGPYRCALTVPEIINRIKGVE